MGNLNFILHQDLTLKSVEISEEEDENILVIGENEKVKQIQRNQFPIVLTGTANLDFPNTPAGTSQDLNVSVAGAVLGDVVSLGVPFGSVEPNTQYTAFVSAPNIVTVRFGNLDISTSRNPNSGDFKIKILK